jgi:hypothetical protein
MKKTTTRIAFENAGEDDAAFDWGSTDELGRFSLQGFVGAEYWIHGSTRSQARQNPSKSNSS